MSSRVACANMPHAAPGLDLHAAGAARAPPACPPRPPRRGRSSSRGRTRARPRDSRCEFSSTATPRPRRVSSSSRTVRRPAGSSALVGSSSSSSFGSPIIACAIPSRCCMPFDIAPTRRSGTSPSPTSSSSSRALRRAAARSSRASDAAAAARPRSASPGSGTARPGSPSAVAAWSRATALPLVGRTSPHAIFTSVDLPAPFGPSSPTSSPSPTREVDALERLVRAVALAQVMNGECVGHGRHPAPIRRSPCDLHAKSPRSVHEEVAFDRQSVSASAAR